jgi:hypothetical protein
VFESIYFTVELNYNGVLDRSGSLLKAFTPPI